MDGVRTLGGVRDLQRRWPGLHWCRWESADGLQSPHGAPFAVFGSCDARVAREYAAGNSRGPGWREFAGTLGQLQAGSGMACSRAMARRVSGSAWRLRKWFPQFPGRSASADAGRGVAVRVGNITAGDTQTPHFQAASSSASGVVSHPATRRACSRSKAERM